MIGSREQPKLRCGKCRRSLCFNCNEAWHEGRSCEDAANSVMAHYKKSHDVKGLSPVPDHHREERRMQPVHRALTRTAEH